MLRLVKCESRPSRPPVGPLSESRHPHSGPVDRSGLCRGNPAEVFEALAPMLGELNFNSYNLKIGVTDHPSLVLPSLPCAQCWSTVKLLWTTRSLRRANLMAHLLHSWDAKLYFDGPFPLNEHSAGPYYAFAAVRSTG